MERQSNRIKFEKVPIRVRAARLVLATMLSAPPVFPTKIDRKENHFSEFNTMLKKSGFFLFFPHFSYREGPAVGQALFRYSREARARRVMGPAAVHQARKLGFRLVSKLSRMEIVPIITPDSQEVAKKMKEKHITPWWEKEGLTAIGQYKEYNRKTEEIIKAGGIVLVAPQGGRRDTLGAPTSAVSHALHSVKGIKNVGVVAVGIAMKDKTDYSRKAAGGFNRGETFVVSFGTPSTREDFLKIANPRVVATSGEIDSEMFGQMNRLAPLQYQTH